MKTKKPIILFGLLGSLVVPIGTIVSCSSIASNKISRYDAENDQKLKIAATFSATGAQSQALETIIAKYNAWVDNLGETEKAKGYMKIEPLVTVSGGYGKAMDQLRTKFTAKDKKTLSNLIIDYPSSVGVLKSYDMHLNLKDVLPKADFDALKGKFEPNFWAQNDKIGGVAAGGAYAIPISVSTMANAINTPLLAYVINEIKRIDSQAIDFSDNKNPRLKKLYDQGKKSNADLVEIKKMWGQMSGITFEENEVTDKILDEFDSLIKFAIKCQKGFDKAVDNSKSLHLLALDSPTNLVQMLSYAYANGDMSKFYITKEKDGYVNYKFLKDKKSDSYKNFKKAIDLIREGVSSGAVWIGGIGAYGSSLLINHQAMMSLGSSAGASHWYASGRGAIRVQNSPQARVEAIFDKSVSSLASKMYIKGESTIVKKAWFLVGGYHQKFYSSASRKSTNWHSHIKFISGYNEDNLKADVTTFPILVKVRETNNVAFKNLGTEGTNFKEIGVMPGQENAKTYLVKTTFYNTHLAKNKFTALAVTKAQKNNFSAISSILYVKDSSFIQPNSYIQSGKHKNKLVLAADKATSLSKWDVILKDALTKPNLLTKFTASGASKFAYLVSVANENAVDFKTQHQANVEEIGKNKMGKTFFIAKSSIIQILTKAQTLQANEVDGHLAPVKVASGTKGGVYVQGPSLIPVHSNAAENKALGLFIKWFTGDFVTAWKDDDKNKYVSSGDLTPLMYWLEKANYVAPIKGAFDDNSKIGQTINNGVNSRGKRYWIGVEIAWKTFNKAKKDAAISPIIQPVDAYSSIARNDVTDVVVKKIYTSAHTTGTTKTFDKIYEQIQLLAKSNDVI